MLMGTWSNSHDYVFINSAGNYLDSSAVNSRLKKAWDNFWEDRQTELTIEAHERELAEKDSTEELDGIASGDELEKRPVQSPRINCSIIRKTYHTNARDIIECFEI